jgi:hypothetical protein
LIIRSQQDVLLVIWLHPKLQRPVSGTLEPDIRFLHIVKICCQNCLASLAHCFTCLGHLGQHDPGSFLFVSHIPRWPRQEGLNLRIVGLDISLCVIMDIFAGSYVNVRTTWKTTAWPNCFNSIIEFDHIYCACYVRFRYNKLSSANVHVTNRGWDAVWTFKLQSVTNFVFLTTSCAI